MSHDIVHKLANITAALALSALAAGFMPASAGAQPSGGNTSVNAPQPLPELALRRQVVVSGTEVRLSDLFDGQISAAPGVDGDTIVAYSPQPGRRAIFDAEWLARLAYRYRLNWRPATRLERAIVERASTIVSGEVIRFALTDELAQRGFGDDYEVALSNPNLMIHIASDQAATAEIVNMSVDPVSERFNAVVSVPAGDPSARRYTVAGRLFAMIDVPVPVTTLRPGETIHEGDIKWVPVRAATVRESIVTDINNLIDMEPRRALRQDTPVRRSDLRLPLDVEKDQIVTMIFETANMSLSATGVAEQDGAVGDIIRVRNSQTKLTIDARVTGPDRVAVQILPQLAAN